MYNLDYIIIVRNLVQHLHAEHTFVWQYYIIQLYRSPIILYNSMLEQENKIS